MGSGALHLYTCTAPALQPAVHSSKVKAQSSSQLERAEGKLRDVQHQQALLVRETLDKAREAVNDISNYNCVVFDSQNIS